MNKILLYMIGGIFLIGILFGVIVTSGLNKTGINGATIYGSNMPEECRAPEGQDINAWKEHLGHHENTKYCLEYYK